ncbi:MAG: carbamoyl-phosphate synthase large subunit, partial [Candidatus Nanopelagicales bacterium]
GGCNIQFAVEPNSGRVIIFEINPRVSRSSALASKATGFPIAKIAAKLAIGYTLDEINNDITGVTPASFEPTLDYIVTKVPRFAFEKFPDADTTLTTTMKSVGEAMAIGRSFTESLMKALRSLEKKEAVFSWKYKKRDAAEWLELVKRPHDGRIKLVQQALHDGVPVSDLYDATAIDPWFLDQIQIINEVANLINETAGIDESVIRIAKRHGFSDSQIAELSDHTEAEIRSIRHQMGIRPVYKTVDTCAAEFKALTPYHYSSYDEESEVAPSDKQKVIILGSGPNRIGQGIEFDYSCVHAALTLKDAGYETVMVNCNPETVSTDYDTSDRLYFEPLTLEDVLEVIHAESASGEIAGVIVQLGGQTPLGLAAGLAESGIKIVGTQPDAIHRAEERGEFDQLLHELGLIAPANGMAASVPDALKIANRIGYPVLVRPSYVLGGRGMEIVYDDEMLRGYIERATEITPERPVLVDKFLDDAIEVDVDALFDGTQMYLGGIMEHIEEAGVHSGDSACSLPPMTLGQTEIDRITESTRLLAAGLGVKGLINIQYAISAGVLYVLEANPRASRTVPFVSKATNVQLAKAAARIMLGSSISELQQEGILRTSDTMQIGRSGPIAVKEAVLPFGRFHGVDTVLGPEMKSTGEVMGIDKTFGIAFAKSQSAVYAEGLPTSGKIFVSVADRDKRAMIAPIRRLVDMNFGIVATQGTADVLKKHGVNCEIVTKQHLIASAPSDAKTTVDAILSGEIALVVNTPYGTGARVDGYEIRTAAVTASVPSITTISGLAAAVEGIEARRSSKYAVKSLQEYAQDAQMVGD